MTRKKTANSKTPPATETKKDRFVALLRRESGATIVEIVEATGWQAHSARAMLTGLRKQGMALEKSKVDGVTRYAIAADVRA